jgi:hypothetical protein
MTTTQRVRLVVALGIMNLLLASLALAVGVLGSTTQPNLASATHDPAAHASPTPISVAGAATATPSPTPAAAAATPTPAAATPTPAAATSPSAAATPSPTAAGAAPTPTATASPKPGGTQHLPPTDTDPVKPRSRATPPATDTEPADGDFGAGSFPAPVTITLASLRAESRGVATSHHPRRSTVSGAAARPLRSDDARARVPVVRQANLRFGGSRFAVRRGATLPSLWGRPQRRTPPGRAPRQHPPSERATRARSPRGRTPRRGPPKTPPPTSRRRRCHEAQRLGLERLTPF